MENMLKNKNNFEIRNSFFHYQTENLSDHPRTYTEPTIIRNSSVRHDDWGIGSSRNFSFGTNQFPSHWVLAGPFPRIKSATR